MINEETMNPFADEVETEPQAEPDAFPVTLPENASMQQRLELAEYFARPSSLWDEMGNTLRIKGVIYHDDFKRDNDGGYLLDDEGARIPAIRTIFLLTDGTLRSSTSPLTSNYALKKILPVFGRPGQKMGHLVGEIGLKVLPYKTANNRRSYDFAIVE